MKNIRVFYLKIFNFLVVKFSVHLNRHVFVMGSLVCFEVLLVKAPYFSKTDILFSKKGLVIDMHMYGINKIIKS